MHIGQSFDVSLVYRVSDITSAMHNIIASEQSGVECACAWVIHVVQNCVSHI